MPGVYYCSPTNSTHFTTCCNVAIVPSQEKCPVCRLDVYPYDERMSDKQRAEAGGGYHHHNVNMARHAQAGWNRR